MGDASATGNAGILKGCQMIQIDSADVSIVAAPGRFALWKSRGSIRGSYGGRRFSDALKSLQAFDRDHEDHIRAGSRMPDTESMESMQSAEEQPGGNQEPLSPMQIAYQTPAWTGRPGQW